MHYLYYSHSISSVSIIHPHSYSTLYPYYYSIISMVISFPSYSYLSMVCLLYYYLYTNSNSMILANVIYSTNTYYSHSLISIINHPIITHYYSYYSSTTSNPIYLSPLLHSISLNSKINLITTTTTIMVSSTTTIIMVLLSSILKILKILKVLMLLMILKMVIVYSTTTTITTIIIMVLPLSMIILNYY